MSIYDVSLFASAQFDACIQDLVRCVALTKLIYGERHLKLAQAHVRLATAYFQYKGNFEIYCEYIAKMNRTLWIFNLWHTHNSQLIFDLFASPWYLKNYEKGLQNVVQIHFSLLWLFNVAGSAVALCSLRLRPAGPGALGAGSRDAASLLLLQRRKAGGSDMSPEHTPHTGRCLTDNSQISLPWYVWNEYMALKTY